MAQTELDSSLIKIAPGELRRGDARELSGGIVEQMTCSLFVWLQTDTPPIFDLNSSRRTIFVREFGYKLVETLVGARRLLPNRLSGFENPTGAQRAYRRVRNALAMRLVLPEIYVADDLDGRQSNTLKDIAPFSFQATRRVFKFENDSAPANRLICHVFAQNKGDATERLLVEWVKSVGKGQESGHMSLRCDRAADLCLWSKPSPNVGRSVFREVVIAPWSNLPQDSPLAEDNGHVVGQTLLGQPSMGTMDSLRQAETSVAAEESSTEGSEFHAAFNERLYERADRDWNFVAAEIETAHRRGLPLNDQFVETVARQRLEHAKTYRFADRPDAGPTFESSLSIVHSIVDLHLAALKQSDTQDS